MIVTTTPSVEGKTIREYRGIVVGEAILGANVFRDVFAQITDIVGGRSGAYEKSLQEARETALRELEEIDARVSQVAIMKVFGGMSNIDIGDALKVSEVTVKRDWNKARAFLADAV